MAFNTDPLNMGKKEPPKEAEQGKSTSKEGSKGSK